MCTTSHPFGLGKGLAVKKIQRDTHFRKMARVFNRYKAAYKEAIIEAGENALVSLYGGDLGEKLDTLRYKMFCEKVSKSLSHVEPQSLPPISAATKHHSLRVYYQIME